MLFTARTAPRRTALAVSLIAALLGGPALAGTAAAAAPKPKPTPTPPAVMSKLGGDRFGMPGTQVNAAPGVPALPTRLTARSWIVADAETGAVLAEHNAHWRLAPASTLKMLFADTVLPRFPKTEVHTVADSDLAGMGAGSSLVGIKEHLAYTVHDLWLGVFLRSGNDAVHVLAAMNGGVSKTVSDMNAEAHELQAADTHVVSPDGYDMPGQVSSAYDLTLFARQGLQNADFREYCSTVSAQFPGDYKKDKKGKPTKVRESFGISNTNRLLAGDYDLSRYPGIAGVKNGNTTNAGATFTGVAQRGGHTLLVTVMNPSAPVHDEVYREGAALLDWGFKAEPSVSPVGTLVPPLSKLPKTPAPTAKIPPLRQGQTAGATSASSASWSHARWTAVGLAAATAVLLALIVIVVRRRRPLPSEVGPAGRGGRGGPAARTARRRIPWTSPAPGDGPGNPGPGGPGDRDSGPDPTGRPADGDSAAPDDPAGAPPSRRRPRGPRAGRLPRVPKVRFRPLGRRDR
ncbi:D-alanyl-D-alanine carboxypeptidase family protein [Streptomyces sp. NBC_01190]|uniref:D-alanyl-D-alanine carboxypeptidase family protein n=1 Tax=Streptomyces sp. NBC_01190 TaxID=2903767 RepID=UPI0038631A48|nr:D-alanyl-D-alanine carboxypeptidase [Streptomyces sp. NBC_01190]